METDPHQRLPFPLFVSLVVLLAKAGGGVGVRLGRSTVLGFPLLLLLLPMSFSIARADEGNRLDRYSLTEAIAAEPAPSTIDTVPSHSRAASGGCLFCPEYGSLLLQDTRYVLSSPLRWDHRDWQTFALGTLAGISTALLLDKPVQEAIRRNRNGTTDTLGNIFEPFGSYYSFGILGGFYLAGTVLDDSRAKNVTQDGIAASLIASGIISPVLKFSIGRSRPSQDEGTHTFRPFSGNSSFPSGHTTQAFAVASVVAAHYDSLWIQTSAYVVATLAGFARIDHAAHFVSDVVAGALIGSAVGNAVVRFNTRKPNRFHVYPLLDRDVRGMTFAFTY